MPPVEWISQLRAIKFLQVDGVPSLLVIYLTPLFVIFNHLSDMSILFFCPFYLFIWHVHSLFLSFLLIYLTCPFSFFVLFTYLSDMSILFLSFLLIYLTCPFSFLSFLLIYLTCPFSFLSFLLIYLTCPLSFCPFYLFIWHVHSITKTNWMLLIVWGMGTICLFGFLTSFSTKRLYRRLGYKEPQFVPLHTCWLRGKLLELHTFRTEMVHSFELSLVTLWKNFIIHNCERLFITHSLEGNCYKFTQILFLNLHCHLWVKNTHFAHFFLGFLSFFLFFF